MQISSLLRGPVVFSCLAWAAFAGTARAGDPGEQDTSFQTGPEADASVHALVLQPNLQVVVGGDFDTFRGLARNGLARLNADGSLDSFNPGLAITGEDGAPSVTVVALQANGQVLATGAFTVEGQLADGGVVRLNADGSLDAGFNAGSGVNDDGDAVGVGLAMAALPSGQVLVGGSFLKFNGAGLAGLARLNSDGSVDTTFNPGGGGIAGNGYGRNGGDVSAIVVDPAGRIYIGGHFSSYDGHPAGSVARLNADGTYDTSFNVGTGASTGINALALQADGSLLAGGDDNFDSVPVPFIVRLNSDGSLDTSYDPSQGVTIDGVDSIAVQSDGSALVGGVIYDANGLTSSPGDGVVRILADGTQDTSFASGGSALETVALALQPDGEALIGSNVYTLSGVETGDVYRIFDLTTATGGATASVAAGVAQTNENSGTPATFVISLDAVQTEDVKVEYTVKGSAGAGYNYEALKGHAKIKAGNLTKTVKVVPIDRGISGGKVSVKLVLTTGPGYAVGTPASAKVKIFNTD